MAHFWDPLVLCVLESGGADDGETDQEHILKQKSSCQSGKLFTEQCSYSFWVRKWPETVIVLLPKRVPESEVDRLPIHLK